MVTWGDKMYLFGGTDGVHWFNDVWSYSPHTNSWTQLECIGYIPSPREGHAASLVGDVMYIFGGRTEEGNDLGDLAAFRISSRRWYTFQNMGPSPSPRSGHSMTTVGKSIVILAGEPSSAPRDPVELSYAYFLDTGKIRYPPDQSAQQQQQQGQGVQHRRPSGDKSTTPVGAGRAQPLQSRDLVESPRSGSANGIQGRSESVKSDNSMSRLPQAARPQGQLPAPAPVGPPPQVPPQQQPRPNGVPQSRQPSRPDRALSPSTEAERTQSFDRGGTTSPQSPRGIPPPQDNGMPTSPSFAPDRSYYDIEQQTEQPRTYKPETYQPSQDQSADTLSRTISRGTKSPQEDTQRIEETPRESLDVPEEMSKVRDMQKEDEGPQDSGIGSSPALTQQYDDLMRELEQAKQRNAWYASELALARKSGYQTRSAESPVMDERAPDVFGDEDKPLIEALLKMKAELARVQETIDEQSKNAAERIAEMEKQRDAAINEAVYAKTRLAGRASPQPDVEGKRSLDSTDQDRNNEMSRKLASSLNAQSELSKRIDRLMQETDSEKQARQLAEDTAEVAQKRATELDMYRQQHSSEMESLRSELHEAQRAARDASASHAEYKSRHDMLVVGKREVDDKLESSQAETQNHSSILSSLREAVAASDDRAQMLEERLEEERDQRSQVEQKLRQLKADHEERTSELETTSRRLREAEDMSEKHAEEARTHRGAVLAGLGKVAERDSVTSQAADERVSILQAQVDNATAMVRENQNAADSAAEKLRRAEERIAGLESFQDQASREGLSVRKQLQAAMKENHSLSSQKAELEQKFQSQMLETNALAVQHASLRDILGERGINAAEVRRSRAMDSPSSLSRFSTPDLHRVKELEQQLEASLKSHDEMKAQFEEVSERDEKMKREYEEKLTALDNDHQAAVKYLRGTEKMLSKMKQELQRVKDENRDLKKKLDKAKDEEGGKRLSHHDHEAERERLKKELADTQSNLKLSVSDLESRLETMQQQLDNAEDELQQTRMSHATSRADLSTLQATHSQSRSDIEKLQKENTILEERARDAENKVQLLLDQVESSVDNYRRQSRMGEGVPTMNGTFHRPLSGLSENNNAPNGGGGGGHSRSISDSANSIISDVTASGGDGRNSLALDALAGELETLRSHWETTKNFRLSDKFDFERGPTGAQHGSGSGSVGGDGQFNSLANWRRGLDVTDEEERSRPTTSDGREDEGESMGAGEAVTTPTQRNMI